MANSFDFELKADDQVSAAIQRIDEAVKKLDPLLGKTADGLKLGGQESVDGLDTLTERLSKMSISARDNVQFIGDMVPPLKMVGELGGKMSGALKFGAAGAAAYGVGKAVGFVVDKLNQASKSAYDLDVAAKNSGMGADDFSRLSGAMQILGVNAEFANQSTEGLFVTFNEALQGRSDGVLASLQQIGVQIVRNKNGTADVLATMQRLAQVLPTLSSEKQKTVADAIGLDANGLMLLREGARLKELLAKSDTFGLTVDPVLNGQLTELNGTFNELGAAYEGLKNKVKNGLFKGLLSDSSVKDGLEGVTDVLTNGVNSISLGHALGINRGKEAEQLRWGYNNPEFYKTLSASDKAGVELGYMTDGYREKYQAWQKPVNVANQLQNDLQATLPMPTNVINSLDSTLGNTPEQKRLSQLETQYNLPNSLLDRVWKTESGRGKNMLSPAGAEGHFQFMPATGRDYGLNNREDRMDFTKSSEAAARYLSDLLKMFDGDVPKAVAAYNWGPGRVKDYGLGSAPAETRNYLQQIMPGLPRYYAQSVESDSGLQLGGGGEDSIYNNQQNIISGDRNDQHQRLASAIANAMRDNKSQIELTLIDSKTGERRSVTGAGGRVATSLNLQ